MAIIKYTHHGRTVSVDERLKGKHMQACLCYRCSLFLPNSPRNCMIARDLLKFDKEHSVVTPVWECEIFREI